MNALALAFALTFSTAVFAQAPATPASAPKVSKAKQKVDDVPAKKPAVKKPAKKAEAKPAPAKK